ncbi:Uncharacterised protein [Achromobacter xylosoxidans]|nr:Uncharacterised protein [Achromobacter xylosoxidans]
MFCVVFTPDALRDIVNMQRYFSAAGLPQQRTAMSTA